MPHAFPILLLSLLIPALPAQTPTETPGPVVSWIESGQDLRLAFAPLVADVRSAVIQVRGEDDEEVLGTVVDPTGWVLTKASTAGEHPVCILADGTKAEATTLLRDVAQDLVLLQIPAKDLPAASFEPKDDWKDGQWLASVGLDKAPLGVGVVSVLPRRIASHNGFLGVLLEDVEGGAGARIAQVLPETAAERAGLQVDDVVVDLDGEAVKDREELISRIGSHPPGTEVAIGIHRGEEHMVVRTALGSRTETPSPRRRRFRHNFSERRDGFPLAVQHDTVLRASECGSPVVDVRGRCVGLNIARASRYSTLAIPASAITKFLERARETVAAAAAAEPATTDQQTQPEPEPKTTGTKGGG